MMYEISIKIPGKKGHPLAKMSISESDLCDIYDHVDGERDKSVIAEAVAGLIEDSGIVYRKIDVQVTIDLTMLTHPATDENIAINDIRNRIGDFVDGLNGVRNVNFTTAKRSR